MSFNNNGRADAEKTAKSKGYSWNSSGTSMHSGNKTLKFSPTGGSVNLNGSWYNDPAGLKKSKKW